MCPTNAFKTLLPAGLLLLLAGACGPEDSKKAAAGSTPDKSGRVALPEMPTPKDNPITPEKVTLGKQLFFDVRLSKTGDMSCETCHQPSKGWADAQPRSKKFDGKLNARHTPTLLNAGYYKEWYWDGSAATLEGQVTAAWKGQMGGDPDAVAKRLNEIAGYKTAFKTAMGGPATADSIAKALATFVRTIVSDDSPWDRYETQKDTAAVSEDAIKGFKVFSDVANCAGCHTPPLYTDLKYHNIGVGTNRKAPKDIDGGRGKFLQTSSQQAAKPEPPDAKKLFAAFKTPTLRSITETGPYFHDGSAKDLDEAVNFLLRGGAENRNRDENLTSHPLKAEERAQLVAFIKTLTPEAKPFEKPTVP